jgi:hypothetical protein
MGCIETKEERRRSYPILFASLRGATAAIHGVSYEKQGRFSPLFHQLRLSYVLYLRLVHAFPHGTSTSITASMVPYCTTHSILRCRVPISGVQVITAALRPTLTHSNYSISLAPLSRLRPKLPASYRRDSFSHWKFSNILTHQQEPQQAKTHSRERLPSTPSITPCANSPQASTSPSSQPSSLHGLQAAVAATGNSSDTSLTSREPRFYPSAAMASSSFVHTAVTFPIDDPGASCVTVPDSAALTVVSRKKVRMMTAPSASAVVVACRTTALSRSCNHCRRSLQQGLRLRFLLPPPQLQRAGRRTVRDIASTRPYLHRKMHAPSYVATRTRILRLSVLDLALAESRCAATACSTGGAGPIVPRRSIPEDYGDSGGDSLFVPIPIPRAVSGAYGSAPSSSPFNTPSQSQSPQFIASSTSSASASSSSS